MEMNLYELTGQLLDLEQMIEDGDIDDETLLDTWESLDLVFEDKAEAYAKVIRNMGASADALKAEERRLADKRKAIENGIERMKASLMQSMRLVDKPKFKTDLFSFGIQANPPKVIIDDEGAIPACYLIEQAPKIDRAAIAKTLKAGEDVKGAHLEHGESLRIR